MSAIKLRMMIDGVKVSRTYTTSDGLAKLHVTFDRRVWLDCGGDRTAYCGRLPDDVAMLRSNVRKLANQ